MREGRGVLRHPPYRVALVLLAAFLGVSVRTPVAGAALDVGAAFLLFAEVGRRGILQSARRLAVVLPWILFFFAFPASRRHARGRAGAGGAVRDAPRLCGAPSRVALCPDVPRRRLSRAVFLARPRRLRPPPRLHRPLRGALGGRGGAHAPRPSRSGVPRRAVLYRTRHPYPRPPSRRPLLAYGGAQSEDGVGPSGPGFSGRFLGRPFPPPRPGEALRLVFFVALVLAVVLWDYAGSSVLALWRR